jgi:hypothetical protein
VLEVGLSEFLQMASVVSRFGRARVPVVSSLEDVLRIAGQFVVADGPWRHGSQKPPGCSVAGQRPVAERSANVSATSEK